MKKICFFLSMFLLPFTTAAQNVDIPDAVFKSVLVNNAAINTNGDSEIQLSEAMTFSGRIDVSAAPIEDPPVISDMTGLEAFTSLTELDCGSNNLSSLDVSANIALTSLYCYSNQLSNLDVSANTALQELACSGNQLNNLDISANIALIKLSCSGNQLGSLDVSANTALQELSCTYNQLGSLDVSANTALNSLYCYSNQLKSLVVGTNTALTSLFCSKNQLSSLDVGANTVLKLLSCSTNQLGSLDVSTNTALTSLFCDDNQVSSLDVSANTVLQRLSCLSNQLGSLDVSENTQLYFLRCNNNLLSSLNVRNGNNSLFTEFDATNNPSLTCISVDDVEYATANWTNIDVWTTFYTDCGFVVDFTADVIIGDAPLTVQFTDATSDSPISWSWDFDNDGIEDSDLQNPSYTYVTAGTYSVSLETGNGSISYLKLKNGFITVTGPNANFSADLTSGPGPLDVRFSDLSTGSITSWLWDFGDGQTSTVQSPMHSYTDDGNYTVSLTVSDGINSGAEARVDYIYVGQNVQIPDPKFKAALIANESINTNGDSEIQFSEAWNFSGALNISFHDISDMTGLEAFTSLTMLSCEVNSLSKLDVSANTELTYLQCDSNKLSSLDVSKNQKLEHLGCEGNPLGSLDISANMALTWLDCSSNQLSSLDVSANTALNVLYCDANQLNILDVSTNTALQELSCGGNQLTSLDVGENTQLYFLGCNNNLLSSLDLTLNGALQHLGCWSNQLSSLDVRNGNNQNLTEFNATNNQSLTCISVDDVKYATVNWTNIDAVTSFSLDCFVDEITGLMDINTEKLSYYPNPVSDVLTVESEIPLTKIELYSFMGKQVKEVNSDFEFIRLNHLSNGVYILKIYTENGIENKKLVKY